MMQKKQVSKIVFLIREEMFDQFKDQVGKKYDDHIEVNMPFKKWMIYRMVSKNQGVDLDHGVRACGFWSLKKN